MRPAATIMMVRDVADAGGSRLEVLMLQRNARSEFAGGFYVFPGGAVDPEDGGRAAEALCAGRNDPQASALLGVPEGGLAYWVAALRESFEEAGLLLAYDQGGSPHQRGSLLGWEGTPHEARFAAHRRALNDKATRFLELCTQEGLTLAVDQVHYFAHWITPAGAPRRYDTRFFVAPAPPGQTAGHDQAETVEHVWTTPQEALRRHREGRIELVLPTIKNLQAIERFSTSAELLAAAEAASGSVPAMQPRVLVEGNGVRILLPGDPGYDEAAPLGDPAPPADPARMNGAIRAISRAANPDPDQHPAPSEPRRQGR